MTDIHQHSAVLFPIGELSQRTGVNSITLRAWERRYGLLKPARTDKGHRLYNQADVERVLQALTLIERGVPLRKIRPLLDRETSLSLVEQDDDARQWQQELWTQLESGQLHRLARRLQELFKQYPVSWCRTQVMQPLVADLAQHASAAALEALLQAELMRYALRYWPSGNGKQQPELLVLGGVPTAPWRTLLLALELKEKHQHVQWLPGAFSLHALQQMLALQPQQQLLYCLDGVLNAEQKQQLEALLHQSPQLWLQGTAVELAFAGHGQLYNKMPDSL